MSKWLVHGYVHYAADFVVEAPSAGEAKQEVHKGNWIEFDHSGLLDWGVGEGKPVEQIMEGTDHVN